MSVALRRDGVSVSYGDHPALEDISLVVETGDAVALVGPNGAGKSTLLRAVLGLQPVSAGSIEVLGSEPADARRRMAYVPQVDTLDPEFPVSVFDVALMGRYRRIGWFRRPGRHDRAAALQALADVGLADLARRRFGALSGGQRQRVLLARSICSEAELFLLDEPFNGVDAQTADSLVAVLKGLVDGGAALLMSTHDLDIAEQLCNLACVVDRTLLAFGPLDEVISEGVLEEPHPHAPHRH